MGYDARDRLLSVASAAFGQTAAAYTYDALDTLTSVRVSDQTRDDWYDSSNRLTNLIDASTGQTVAGLGDDALGNLINHSGKTFDFDRGHRLRKVSDAGQVQEVYRYDAFGRRALAWSPVNGNVRSQYGQDGTLWYQVDDRRQGVVAQGMLNGSRVAEVRWPSSGTLTTPPTTRYTHTDALHSAVVETDAAGALLSRATYAPYGARLGSSGDDGPGDTGHVEDRVTGLVYAQQRDYDPGIGRFLSVDPVTADGNTGANFNRYKYAENNPYKFTDPDGRTSYLVSRPLDSAAGAVANHNFIVHHANGPGDSNASVRSFGITTEGTMGEVTTSTEGPNANTSAMDRSAWESVGGEGSDVTFREINASDDVVQANADSVSSSFNYSYVPEVSGGFNSNTAAGAVAQESDGGSPRVDNGQMQPGTSQERVNVAREQVLHEPIREK
jgi:RHS repeat-associated protein